MDPVASTCPLPRSAVWRFLSLLFTETPFHRSTALPKHLLTSALRSGHRLFQRLSPQKQFASNIIAILLTALTSQGFAQTAPYPEAVERAAVVQTPMATEIPGSIILGNGDLNGILWVHQGRLRFSITKNDACDGRLDTSKDPELCRIDVRNHKWTAQPRAVNPPSWDYPYPCPLTCGHVEFGGSVDKDWTTVRFHDGATVGYDEGAKQVTASIKGIAGDSAGWGFSPKTSGKRVTAKLSGSSNAKWYFDFPGTGINSGWQAVTKDTAEVGFDIPAGATLNRIDFYVQTTDGQSAEIRLHSVAVDAAPQLLAGLGTLGQTGGCESRLDLVRAMGTVTRSGAVSVTARVLAGCNAAVFETSSSVSLSPCSAGFIPASKGGKQGDVEWVLTTVPGDEDWPGMSFSLAHAAKGTRHVVAVATSLEAKDPVAAAVTLAGNVLGEDTVKQIEAHEAVWREFWSKSGVALADTYLESVWYRNLYFLRSFSKPGVQPVGLFLGCATDVMPWHGVPTTDYNFEQCFWPAFSCNHAELAEPYIRYMVDYLPRGKWFAKETYGLEGAHYPVNHFTHQVNDPSVCKSKNQHMNFYIPWSYAPGANGWQAHNVWLNYLYHPDRDYLQKCAYPVVKQMAIFYAEFLEQCRKTPEGKAVYGPTYSPEHRDFGADDTPCDIAWTRFTLKAAIQGAQTLGGEEAMVKRWQAALALVPDYPVTPKTNPPVIADVRGGEPIQYNVPVPVLPVFPAGEINWWSSEAEKEIFDRTIKSIKTDGYNSNMILAGARARLSLPDTHEWITTTFKKLQMANGFLMLQGDRRGNYSEQAAAAGIVSEMLMQSVGDIIRVFPAWSKDKNASFTGLRAQGGFLVSAEQKDGNVVKLEIKSTAGGKLQLLNPWTGKIVEAETKPGETKAFKP